MDPLLRLLEPHAHRLERLCQAADFVLPEIGDGLREVPGGYPAGGRVEDADRPKHAARRDPCERQSHDDGGYAEQHGALPEGAGGRQRFRLRLPDQHRPRRRFQRGEGHDLRVPLLLPGRAVALVTRARCRPPGIDQRGDLSLVIAPLSDLPGARAGQDVTPAVDDLGVAGLAQRGWLHDRGQLPAVQGDVAGDQSDGGAAGIRDDGHDRDHGIPVRRRGEPRDGWLPVVQHEPCIGRERDEVQTPHRVQRWLRPQYFAGRIGEIHAREDRVGERPPQRVVLWRGVGVGRVESLAQRRLLEHLQRLADDVVSLASRREGQAPPLVQRTIDAPVDREERGHGQRDENPGHAYRHEDHHAQVQPPPDDASPRRLRVMGARQRFSVGGKVRACGWQRPGSHRGRRAYEASVFARVLLVHPLAGHGPGDHARVEGEHAGTEHDVVEVPDDDHEKGEQRLAAVHLLRGGHELSGENACDVGGKPQRGACHDHDDGAEDDAPVFELLAVVVTVELRPVRDQADRVAQHVERVAEVLDRDDHGGLEPPAGHGSADLHHVNERLADEQARQDPVQDARVVDAAHQIDDPDRCVRVIELLREAGRGQAHEHGRKEPVLRPPPQTEADYPFGKGRVVRWLLVRHGHGCQRLRASLQRSRATFNPSPTTIMGIRSR